MNRWSWFQAISFQVLWFSCVLGGNAWLAAPIAILGLHLVLSPCLKADVKVLSLALIGVSLDASLSLVNVFAFQQIPLWLVLLWLGFVLNFGHSLRFLRHLHLLWQIVIGAAGGCYAYLASWKLGAVEFPLGLINTACIIAVAWALLLPMLVSADAKLRERETL